MCNAPRVEVKVNADKADEGALCLELKTSSRFGLDNFWNFLDRFGFHHGGGSKRPLLPFEVGGVAATIEKQQFICLCVKYAYQMWHINICIDISTIFCTYTVGFHENWFLMIEVPILGFKCMLHSGIRRSAFGTGQALQILKSIPEETKKKLAGKGLFPQIGFIMQCLPVPPNCLSVPDVSNGTTIMSSDLSSSMLRKVLNKSDIINRSRFGCPNFESYQIEANDLQSAVAQYMLFRGTTKAPHDMARKYGAVKEPEESSTKAWLEKMRTLFIRKGSGFSSRSVITGDAYKGIQEIGLPLEIAQKITFEEKVTTYNMDHLQKLVDEKLCVTYRDGSTTYAIREGSKGHTYLKVGQIINRRIMDGDIVFINRPPSTHKHSLQAFSVYVHDDHTVKINPLICAPLGADFDGDCVHIFYPQSLAAKAEVLELFSVEKQIRSSHTGSLNLQLVQDSLLCLKLMFRTFCLEKASAQQLAMVVSEVLPEPALLRAYNSGPQWTIFQIFQSALPSLFDCSGDRHLISKSELLRINFNRDLIQSSFTEIVSSILNEKGPEEAVMFFNKLQPLLMEILSLEGYTVGLNDFDIPRVVKEDIEKKIQEIAPLLLHLRSNYNELVELQVENYLKKVKLPIVTRILRLSALGNLIDSKSDSSISKVVQQLGFLGLQLYDHGKFYSRHLVEDMNLHFQQKYSIKGFDYSSEAFGLIKSSFFQGLNPYEEMVHSISSREVLIRSSRGLIEPGTLFKNLMAILRDVVICYDGTARNLCSNSIIQFEYGQETENNLGSASLAGEPVGVLAATAVSNPAYKAVLDSSPSNNSSWESMKVLYDKVSFWEILLCKVNFKNDIINRKQEPGDLVMPLIEFIGDGQRLTVRNDKTDVKLLFHFGSPQNLKRTHSYPANA
ncbi:hypothetical protein ACLOJK_000893 [Asimina triloba]